MKDENPPPSELRQHLDILGVQLTSNEADREVVFKTCQCIAMIAGDAKNPMPEDVFASGVNDNVARLMLSSACMMVVRMAQAPQLQQRPGIIK